MSKTTIHSIERTLIDRAALKTRWGISIPTIKRREKDGTLKPIHMPGGRLVRYDIADIERIEQQLFTPLNPR